MTSGKFPHLTGLIGKVTDLYYVIDKDDSNPKLLPVIFNSVTINTVIGLIVSLQKLYVKILTPLPQNVIYGKWD
jgi:hypothetical protein